MDASAILHAQKPFTETQVIVWVLEVMTFMAVVVSVSLWIAFRPAPPKLIMYMFGLGRLIYVILLLVNSAAILSEDRFLNRIGWGSSEPAGFGQAQDQSVKNKLINLISAIRTLLRIPLIIANTLVIVYEVVLG
ncbi:Protein transport protein [Yarrowia sp. B02]|nr:Protein transport protein [Yarrowia sp. B02]